MKRTIQVIGLLICIIGFIGLMSLTDVYDDVQRSVVEVLCLSCLKLDPVLPSDAEFTFETAIDDSHPDFVLDNLSSGIVFLHYSKDACAGCDVMLPTIQQLFSVEFGKQDMFQIQLDFNGTTVHYHYINIDHTTKELEKTFAIYDKDYIDGLPMFTILTIFYDHGIVKPYYTSLYGTLGPDNNSHEKRFDYLTDLINYCNRLWQENIPGYEP